MARIEEGFVTHLSGVAALVDLIGNRIYPMHLPEGVDMPAITYQRISGNRMRSHSGPSGTANPRYTFTCWAETYGGAKAVADQLRFILDGFNGAMGGVDVQAGLVEDDRDDFDTQLELYQVQVDAILWHAEALV